MRYGAGPKQARPLRCGVAKKRTGEVDGGDGDHARVALEHAVRREEAVEVGAGGGGDAEARMAGRGDHRKDAPAEGGAQRLEVVQREACVQHVARHALRLQLH